MRTRIQWTKLYGLWRKRHLDDRLQKRVSVSRACYRGSHDDMGNALYVTFDGNTVYNNGSMDGWGQPVAHAMSIIVVGDTIDNLLSHSDEFIRGLSYLDARFGKGRIPEKMLTETDEFARECLKLKMSLYPDLKINGNHAPN